ncbi:MAG: EamA family transporter [Candidatus Magasanikbacteria bacterium]
MLWVLAAVLGYFCWALVNVGDKVILNHRIKSPYVYLFLFSLTGLLGLFYLPFSHWTLPSLKMFLFLCCSSALYTYGGLPYIKAMKIEEVTRINIWWNLIPVITFVGGWILLGEKLFFGQLAALSILVLGAGLASIHFTRSSFFWSRAMILMLIACFCYSATILITRHVSQTLPFKQMFVINSILSGGFGFTFFLSRRFREDWAAEKSGLNLKLGFQVFGLSVLDRLGTLFNFWALAIAPAAALVFALEGFQTVFILILAVGMSVFNSKLLKEELDQKNILLKFIAVLLIAIGIGVLYLN